MLDLFDPPMLPGLTATSDFVTKTSCFHLLQSWPA
jgi:hypothetical protein